MQELTSLRSGVENYIAIIVGALPGCSSYFKSHIRNSAFFTAISSRFTTSRSSSNQSSKGSPVEAAYQVKELSNDSAGQIGVKHSYEVSHDRV